MSVPPPAHLSNNIPSPPKQSKLPGLRLLLPEHPNSLWTHQIDALKGRNGGTGGLGGRRAGEWGQAALTDLTAGVGSLYGTDSHAANSVTSTNTGE